MDLIERKRTLDVFRLATESYNRDTMGEYATILTLWESRFGLGLGSGFGFGFGFGFRLGSW